MLSKIKIKNFRCLRDASLDLAPLTFIVGPNGSGKSSILMAIQLLKQSIGSTLRFDGEYVRLGSFQNVLYSGERKAPKKDAEEEDENWITLGVHAKLSRKVSESLTLPRHPWIPQGISKLKTVGYEVSFHEEQITQSYYVNNKKIIKFGHIKVRPQSFASKILFPKILEKASVANPHLILTPPHISISTAQRAFPKVDVDSFIEIVRMICSIISNEIASTYYISALRNIETATASSNYFPRWVGQNGQHTVGLLALIFGSREYDHARNKICEWAKVFGLEELRAGWGGRNELRADFRDPKTHALLRVTEAGHGSVQMLPVITQLFWSPEGSTISFEEPEISLHLQLINELPRMFSEVVNDGKQVIVTTHEQNILFALKPLIAKGELPHTKVAIYELKKSNEGSTARKLDLTPEGIIKGGISSFVEAQRNMVFQWVTTVPSVEEEEKDDA